MEDFVKGFALFDSLTHCDTMTSVWHVVEMNASSEDDADLVEEGEQLCKSCCNRELPNPLSSFWATSTVGINSSDDEQLEKEIRKRQHDEMQTGLRTRELKKKMPPLSDDNTSSDKEVVEEKKVTPQRDI